MGPVPQVGLSTARRFTKLRSRSLPISGRASISNSRVLGPASSVREPSQSRLPSAPAVPKTSAPPQLSAMRLPSGIVAPRRNHTSSGRTSRVAATLRLPCKRAQRSPDYSNDRYHEIEFPITDPLTKPSINKGRLRPAGVKKLTYWPGSACDSAGGWRGNCYGIRRGSG